MALMCLATVGVVSASAKSANVNSNGRTSWQRIDHRNPDGSYVTVDSNNNYKKYRPKSGTTKVVNKYGDTRTQATVQTWNAKEHKWNAPKDTSIFQYAPGGPQTP